MSDAWQWSFLVFLCKWVCSTWLGTLYQERYCPEWDAALGALLTKHGEKIEVGRHTSSINGVTIWTANAFYAYGHIYNGGASCCRPGLWNMYRLWWLTQAASQPRKQQEREAYSRKMREVANG